MPRPKKVETETNDGWGGARKGAGKKRMRDEPLVTLAICVEPKSKRNYQLLKEKGCDVRKVVEDTINNLAELMNVQ